MRYGPFRPLTLIFYSQTSFACSSWSPYTHGSASHRISSGSVLLSPDPDPFYRALTPVMKFPRITLRPCFLSATHTRPSSSPPSSIFCSRICPRIPKYRKPSFANVVCQRKPTRNVDGLGCPEGSGSSPSDLSGGNHRCDGFSYNFLYPCQAQ